ncbi:unnamed protein product [Amoebophrya sp. A120]|nr:unnamed protein product [Amoebophrya sp. A120]|eukprot:GSA120T00008199001.1
MFAGLLVGLLNFNQAMGGILYSGQICAMQSNLVFSGLFLDAMSHCHVQYVRAVRTQLMRQIDAVEKMIMNLRDVVVKQRSDSKDRRGNLGRGSNPERIASGANRSSSTTTAEMQHIHPTSSNNGEQHIKLEVVQNSNYYEDLDRFHDTGGTEHQIDTIESSISHIAIDLRNFDRTHQQLFTRTRQITGSTMAMLLLVLLYGAIGSLMLSIWLYNTLPSQAAFFLFVFYLLMSSLASLGDEYELFVSQLRHRAMATFRPEFFAATSGGSNAFGSDFGGDSSMKNRLRFRGRTSVNQQKTHLTRSGFPQKTTSSSATEVLPGENRGTGTDHVPHQTHQNAVDSSRIGNDDGSTGLHAKVSSGQHDHGTSTARGSFYGEMGVEDERDDVFGPTNTSTGTATRDPLQELHLLLDHGCVYYGDYRVSKKHCWCLLGNVLTADLVRKSLAFVLLSGAFAVIPMLVESGLE